MITVNTDGLLIKINTACPAQLAALVAWLEAKGRVISG